MNISVKKKAFIALTLIWLIITFNLVKTTYAKYVTNLDSNTSITISYWNIILNDENIMDMATKSNQMSIVFPRTQYSQKDVIVPGATGYLDLNLDCSYTTIPFKLTVTSSISDESDLKSDLKITGCSVDNGELISLDSDTLDFSLDFSKDVINSKIRVYITWEDDGTDSIEDTELGISGGSALINLKLNFEQIADNT